MLERTREGAVSGSHKKGSLVDPYVSTGSGAAAAAAAGASGSSNINAGVGLFNDIADFSFPEVLSKSERSSGPLVHGMEVFPLQTEVGSRGPVPCGRNYKEVLIRLFSWRMHW